jgi:predicted  nucleic acid-binding Zn-ribbon protein
MSQAESYNKYRTEWEVAKKRQQEIKDLLAPFHAQIQAVMYSISAAKKAKDVSGLKALTERRIGLEQSRDSLKKESRELGMKMQELETLMSVNRPKHKAPKAPSPEQNRFSGEISVSDHCLLRYIQRKYQIPLEDIKSEIAKEVYRLNGLGALRNSKYIIRDNVVITYLGDKDHD